MPIWNTRTRVNIFVIALVLLFLFSIVGYTLIKTQIEGRNVTLIQSLYWTVITIATVGFYPSNVALTSEVGLAFTVAVVISSLVVLFVGLPAIVSPWFEEKLKKAGKGKKAPIPSGGHIIMVGYTDTARHTLQELNMHGFACVVIDDNKDIIEDLESKGIPVVFGDGSEDKDLVNANISGAIGLVVTGKDDKNLFACLTATKLKKDLPITAVARNPETEKLLYKIGVNKVVTPKNAVGSALAKRALGRHDAALTEGKSLLGGLEMRQYTLENTNPIIGKTLVESNIGKNTGIVVVGVWRAGELIASPQPDFTFGKGDIVVALGTPPQLLGLENFFAGVLTGPTYDSIAEKQLNKGAVQ